MTRELTAPTCIDLFAGAGGLAEGLEQSGLKVVLASEVHPQPALTHAINHPDCCVMFGDIRDADMDIFEDRVKRVSGRASVDVVVGGPPCQGFSTAGKKKASDPRNNLFYQFVRVVEHFKPRIFLLENVPGFQKMHSGRAYKAAKESFEGLGYETLDAVLDAAQYGAPQRRTRFIMVGWPSVSS